MAASTNSESSGGLIASFGEMLIDFVPTISGVSLAEASGFLKGPGGAPAIVAIVVARLGGRSAFVVKLGDDEFGHMLAAILKQNGIPDAGVNFDTGAQTESTSLCSIGIRGRARGQGGPWSPQD